MALKDKVQNAMDESRMLILGAQVLLGFQFRAFLEKSFDRLPESARDLSVAALALLLVTVCLILTPGARHRMIEHGTDTAALHKFTTGILDAALFPFALALGAGSFVVMRSVAGAGAAIAFGVFIAAMAIAGWYVVPLAMRKETPPETTMQEETPLSEKVRHVLTEARVVLPGSQALLGFQFTTVLLESFGALPIAAKVAHFVSLALTAIAIVLLILPAAFHRLAENGEMTERMHRFSSAMVLAGLVALAAGIGASVFVVAVKMEASLPACFVWSIGTFAVMVGVWMGVPWLYRPSNYRYPRAA